MDAGQHHSHPFRAWKDSSYVSIAKFQPRSSKTIHSHKGSCIFTALQGLFVIFFPLSVLRVSCFTGFCIGNGRHLLKQITVRRGHLKDFRDFIYIPPVTHGSHSYKLRYSHCWMSIQCHTSHEYGDFQLSCSREKNAHATYYLIIISALSLSYCIYRGILIYALCT